MGKVVVPNLLNRYQTAEERSLCPDAFCSHGRNHSTYSQENDLPFPTICGTSFSFSQMLSISSSSARKLKRERLAVHGFVYVLASSMVSCKLMCPKLVRWKRSVTCNDSVWGCPPSSSHPDHLKPVVSTTSVSLSHLPTE